MKVCVSAATDSGLGSLPFGHFGSAPYFVIHDTEAGSSEVLANVNDHHAVGGCQPLTALGGRNVDASIVGGIGAGVIPAGKDVISVRGSGRGADAAVVLHEAHVNAFFDTTIREILCWPKLP